MKPQTGAGSALSLKERVYTELKQEIIRTRLPPGEIILEGNLAERFGVSKTPVREALAWLQLGIHSIPVGLLNVRGYYDNLLAHLDHARGEGFLAPDHHGLLLADTDAVRLLDRMDEFRV